ncbi:hypothetical protein [Streptomyces beijiangensis]|uniref:Uncharacterized protein n=2 Tax=Streptomyces beijiangensis TaxID=163361 RepID=A0A939F4I8_9ACTN|nr:hypothetical protein [Streptomyces beijiangensis]MBO0512406.1 hypothetical protein [Streptomyces beijiangensis]
MTLYAGTAQANTSPGAQAEIGSPTVDCGGTTDGIAVCDDDPGEFVCKDASATPFRYYARNSDGSCAPGAVDVTTLPIPHPEPQIPT